MKRDAVPTGCTGNCMQGRDACDCELAAWLPPDDTRVIAPPPAPNHCRARDVVLGVLALALLAFGVWIFPH